MTYFLDNNLSPRFEQVLVALGVDARHIANVEGLARDAPDTVWIPVVATNRWVAVGGDSRILKRPAERACVGENGLIYFVFERGFPDRKLWDQAEILIRGWPNIMAKAPGARRGDCFVVKVPTGKVEITERLG